MGPTRLGNNLANSLLDGLLARQARLSQQRRRLDCGDWLARMVRLTQTRRRGCRARLASGESIRDAEARSDWHD